MESAAFDGIVAAAGQSLPLTIPGGPYSWGVKYVETNVCLQILLAKNAPEDTLKVWMAQKKSVMDTISKNPDFLVEASGPAYPTGQFTRPKPEWNRRA